MRATRIVLLIFVPLLAIASFTVLAQPSGRGIRATVAALEAENVVLRDRLDTLEATLANVRRSGDDLFFEGMNVHIRNRGVAEIDGLGNLIVGRNGRRPGDNLRTGSHNLIVGSHHNYSSHGGVVFGFQSTLSAPYATVTGGFGNTASGESSSVTGGTTNVASGVVSWVGGGGGNLSSGEASSVTGGNFGVAAELAASVTGGFRNEALGQFTSVNGGQMNRAEADLSVISGGSSFVATTPVEHVNTHP